MSRANGGRIVPDRDNRHCLMNRHISADLHKMRDHLGPPIGMSVHPLRGPMPKMNRAFKGSMGGPPRSHPGARAILAALIVQAVLGSRAGADPPPGAVAGG